jgi:protein TonB
LHAAPGRREVMEMAPNASLRSDYARHLYVGLLAAILLHAAAFAFWPEYVPSVYRLPVVITDLVDVLIPEYEIPPPPGEVVPPVALADIMESDNVDPGETIRPNFGDIRHMPVVLPPPIKDQTDFFGFDRQPEVIRAQQPVYPDIARRAEIEGRVTVLVTVDEQGRVIHARVAQSDAGVFDEAALAAASGYVFRPAEQNGMPVKATISLTFRFVLTE